MEIGKKQSISTIVKNNFFILKICFRETPVYICMFIFEGIKHMVLVFFEHTYGIQYILEVVEFHRPPVYAFRYLIELMILIAFSQVYSGILAHYMEPRSKPKMIKTLRSMIFEKSKDLDLECYDNPEFYNEFVLSVAQSDKCVERLLVMIANVTRGITLALVVGGYYIFVDAGSMTFILISFAMTVLLGQVTNKFKYKARLEETPIERKQSYLHRVFYLNEYAKEIRMNPEIIDKFFEDFEISNNELYEVEKKYVLKNWVLGFLAKYVSNDLIGNSAYVVYLIYKAMIVHSISYSQVVVLFNSSGNIKNALRNVAETIPTAAENSLFIQKIINFLSYEKKIVSEKGLPVPDKPKKIEFKDVSFAYNAKNGPILHHINMTIEPYEKIALVGYNGAGKTTLVKLLMRLYDATEGEILYDGMSIKDYEVTNYHNQLGVVFQDYQIFAATLKENIIVDNLDAREENQEKCVEECIRTLDEVGFIERLSTLKYGLDTPLTNEFDSEGVSLSGGESQKVAIARVLYKDVNIIILDEPSSALDPIAEYKLNKTMHEVSKHRTVVYISHRLSTTRDADRIYMLENGTITEQGSHHELMKLEGKYAKMWNVQASRYID